MYKFILLAVLTLWTSANAQSTRPISLGVEVVAASASVCPDQPSAQAVITAHATKGIEEARKVYTEKCVSVARVLITPVAVISNTKTPDGYMKIVKVLIRMKDESQTVWYMLTNIAVGMEV